MNLKGINSLQDNTNNNNNPHPEPKISNIDFELIAKKVLFVI